MREVMEVKQLLEEMKSSPIKNSGWEDTVKTLKNRLARLKNEKEEI